MSQPASRTDISDATRFCCSADQLPNFSS